MESKIVPVNGDRCEKCGDPKVMVMYPNGHVYIGCYNCSGVFDDGRENR